MFRAVIMISVLLVGNAALSYEATYCSDANGNLRLEDVEDDGERTIHWFFDESLYAGHKVKGDLRSQEQISGDKHNGVFAAKAKLKTSNVKIKNRVVLCQHVNTEKSKALTADFEPEFTPFIVGDDVSCSSANGRLRRVGNDMGGYWINEGNTLSMDAQIIYNSAFAKKLDDGNTVYQVVIVEDEGQTLPQMIICR